MYHFRPIAFGKRSFQIKMFYLFRFIIWCVHWKMLLFHSFHFIWMSWARKMQTKVIIKQKFNICLHKRVRLTLCAHCTTCIKSMQHCSVQFINLIVNGKKDDLKFKKKNVNRVSINHYRHFLNWFSIKLTGDRPFKILCMPFLFLYLFN